ncbi:MAG: exodeoxyribonuclease VII large subunit [Candidatus Aenigmarchaeota archaeon]|nr:exodeoxyribonuclease VII large subunit [Candidatus Aenigmarchaeota archaeon]
MLSDKQLAKLCLIITVIGIIFLFVVANLQIEEVSIGNISNKDVGKVVAITGSVEGFYSKTGNIFFTLNDNTGNISVVMFNSDLSLVGKSVAVTGKVSLYKSKIEVIADKIKVL